MKTVMKLFVLLSLTAAMSIGDLCKHAAADATARTVKVPGMDEMLVSTPLMHANLAVLVLYRADRPDNEVDYLTLDEATEKELVKITETEQEQVQKLSITYTGTKPLFLAAGELVKGGKQDRTLQSSLVVPPKTNLAALPSFCVEASRWHGGKVFQSAKNVASNASQQALQFEGQGRVWESVRRYKMQLRENAAKVAGTQPKASRTSSLNEELEAGEVKSLLSDYEKAVAKAGRDLACPLGIAYAVDGHVTAVHVFHSSSLFGKFKEKLLRSAAIDAAVGKIDKKPKEVTTTDLQNFLAQAGDGEKKTIEPGFNNKVMRYLNDKTFTSLLAYQNNTVHAQVGRFQKSAGGGELQQIRQSIQQFNVLPNQADQQQAPLQQQPVPRRNNANELRSR